MKKRFLTAFLAACLCMTGMFSGCKRETAGETEPAEETAPQFLTHVYTETELTLPEGYSYSSVASYTADSVTLHCTRWMEEGQWGDENYRSWSEAAYVTYYTDGSEPTIVSLGELSYDQYTTAPDGTAYGIANYFDEATGFSGFRVDRIRDGVTETLTDNLASLFGVDDPSQAMRFFPNGMTTDAAGRLYITTHEALAVIGTDMIPVMRLDDLMSCQGMTRRGEDIFLLYYDSENQTGNTIAPILPDEKKLGDPLALPEGVRAQALYLGEGYDLYYMTETGFWGCSSGDTEGTLLMDPANSNLPDSFSELAVLDSEHLFVRYNIGDGSYLSLLTKGEDIDLSEITILDLATLWNGSSDLNEAVVRWNKAHPDCRIRVRAYSALAAEGENAADMLLREIETGLYTPDLFYLSEEAVIRYLVNRDLLADLYPFMEDEEIFHRDNLFGAVKNTYTTDGTDLYALPSTMVIETVIGDRTVLGDRDGWTIEECLALSEEMTAAGKYIPGEILMDMGNTVFSFIDWENHTCSFDTDLFRRFLAYITDAVQEGERKLAQLDTDPSNRYIPYLEGYLPAAVVEYRRASQILSDILYFGEENKMVVGYPTADGKGGTRLQSVTDVFMVGADCDAKDTAWEFIKSAMPKEEMIWRFHGLAAWKHLFDLQLEEEGGMYCFVRYDGGMSGSSRDFELDPDGTYQGRPGVKTTLTPEKAAAFKAMLDNAGRPLPLTGDTDEITAIMEEEMSALLAGSCTPEECAARIQSRISLWLAEHA